MEFLLDDWSKLSENLAADDWLLARAETHSDAVPEVLRVYRPSSWAVVVGRGSKVAGEVDVEHCTRQGLAVYRRHTGGAAVVLGPGCWVYSVLLDLRGRPSLRDLNRTHQFVMERIRAAAQALVPDQEVQVQGICDLTIDNRKCSGNSLRVARDHVLYHGTLLVDFDLPLLERCLRTPPRQPAYRAERAHGSFVANLPWSRETQDETTLWHDWCQELQRQWQTGAGTSAHVLCAEGREEVRQLAREKYENPQWIWAR